MTITGICTRDFTETLPKANAHRTEYIVSHLKQTVDSGVVSVKPADENEACILRVEVSDDGENWRFIGSWDSMNPEYLKFDGHADRVRFTNIGAKSVQINNIHTALKEWIR